MDQAKIDKLIHTLVADINTLALRKSQNGESWTMQDCKKGAELGREIAKILGGQFEFAEEVVKL
ncbi:hypothetical protein E4L33_004964 [Escherichia coli]|nr:hypothetical protein [Escherichia coli]